MGMTENQKAIVEGLKASLSDGFRLDIPNAKVLIELVEGLERENKNWKEQCGRLIKLIDRIDKDMAQEMLIYRTKTT